MSSHTLLFGFTAGALAYCGGGGCVRCFAQGIPLTPNFRHIFACVRARLRRKSSDTLNECFLALAAASADVALLLLVCHLLYVWVFRFNINARTVTHMLLSWGWVCESHARGLKTIIGYIKTQNPKLPFKKNQ